MESKPSPVISRTYQALLLALSLSGALLVIFASSRFGLGATPDSVTYISVARNIANGTGLVMYDGTPLTFFPPLYPALLALLSAILGRDPVSTARLLNSAFFAIIIYLSGQLFARFLAGSRALAFLGTVSVAVSVPFIPVVLTIYSEPLFICFLLVYFLALEEYLRSTTPSSLLVLTCAVALASLTRYVGLVLIPAAIVSVLLFSTGRLHRKLRHISVFGVLSVLPLSVWVLRNWSVSGTLFGPRVASTHTYAENVAASWNSLLSWYLSPGLMLSGTVVVLVVVVMFLVLLVAFPATRAGLRPALQMTGPLVVFILLYAVFLVISSETAFTQFIDNRYLSPIYVPTTLALLTISAALLGRLSARFPGRIPGILLACAVGLWLLYPATVAAAAIQVQIERGRGYTGRGWRDNQTIRYLRDHPDLAASCTIYSSGNDAIYWFTGTPTKSVPSRTTSRGDAADLLSLNGSWPPEGKACVVQFDEIDRSAISFTSNELMAIATLQTRARLADGTIYVLTRK